jgi:hypothetical protein
MENLFREKLSAAVKEKRSNRNSNSEALRGGPIDIVNLSGNKRALDVDLSRNDHKTNSEVEYSVTKPANFENIGVYRQSSAAGFKRSTSEEPRLHISEVVSAQDLPFQISSNLRSDYAHNGQSLKDNQIGFEQPCSLPFATFAKCESEISDFLRSNDDADW